jgi:hypothetical protein
MLSPEDAEAIVKDCVRQARGSGGDVPVDKRLEEVGIPTQDYVDALRDEIVTNHKVGLPSRGYKIDPNALEMNPKTHIYDLRDQVGDQAVPAE